MKQAIHCIGYLPDYEMYFFERAAPYNFEVKLFNPKAAAKSHFTYKFLSREHKDKRVINKITEYTKENREGIYVFFALTTNFKFALEHNAFSNAHFILRNPISDDRELIDTLARLMDQGVILHSFDYEDCKKYGLHHYRQFAEKLDDIQVIAPSIDFAFVGRDKGRGVFIKTLQGLLESKGYSTLVDIRKSRHFLGIGRNISYKDYLRKNLYSRCMIDIVQNSQSGLTLRPIEALLYGRKLLTNNENIRHEDFYRENNIFIIDESINLDRLDAFMSAPFEPVPNDLLEKYTVTGLLNKITSMQSAR